MAYKLVHNSEICKGCKSCVEACAKHHGDVANLDILEIEDKYTLVTCVHCTKPKCVEVCPTGALQRVEGKTIGHIYRAWVKELNIVAFFKERCVGCKNCVEACVFGVIKENPFLGIINKCDLCYQNFKDNKNIKLYCVEACPTNSLRVKEYSFVKKE